MTLPKTNTHSLHAAAGGQSPINSIQASPGLSRRQAMALLMAAAAVPVVSVLSPTTARSQPNVNSFKLTPGVVVDLNRGRAYVMRPQAGIVAVDLAQGSELWRSNEAARPLAVAGNVLVSQADTPGARNNLRIVALDVREGGRLIFTRNVQLPAGVKALVERTRASAFTLDAQLERGELVVSWEYTERPLRGRPPPIREVLPGEEEPDPQSGPPDASVFGPGQGPASGSEQHVVNGAFRLDLQSGAISEQQLSAPPLRPSGSNNLLAPNARLRGLPEDQFLSADGRHVLISERVANDSVFEKYRWAIYDRNTAQNLGEFRAHLRYSPFFVVDSRVVFESGPYSRRTSAGLVQEPLQIRAVDLRTGDMLWRQPVRDTTGRRPPPPL